MSRPRAGIDVGGTKILGLLLDEDGTVLHTSRVPTPEPALLADAIIEMGRQLGDWETLGIGIAGLVTRTGVVRAAPNLHVRELPLGELAAKAFGRPVEVDNDATCALVAEWLHGAAKGCDEVLLVTLGTGIGGGIVSNGRLARGANGFSGEIGHMVIALNGPECTCGRRGCWERFASGTALGHQGEQAARRGHADRILALAGGDAGDIRGEHVEQAAREGDAEALILVDDYARFVAVGLVNLTNAFDPQRYVIGGGLAASGDLFLPAIRKWFAEAQYGTQVRPLPEICVASLGEQAGAIGAALLVVVH